MRNHAQQMQRIGVLGLTIQDLAVDRFSLRKLASAVVLEGCGNRLLNWNRQG